METFMEIITMNCELGSSVIINSATDVSACIFRGAFVDDQSALSAEGVGANHLSWFQFHIILQMKNVSHVLYTFKILSFLAISTISYLEPFNFCICSGHFTFKSNLLLLRNIDIHNGFGDHGRRLCMINTCCSK